MKKLNIKLPEKLDTFVSVAGFKLQKHSPELLIGAGVVGVIAGTVMACKATTKLDEVIDETSDKIEKVNKLLSDEEFREEHLKDGMEYTEEDANKDKFIIYTQTGVKIAKLYGPAIILEVLAVSAIIGSHTILKRRNVALAAAFETTHNAFKAYRGRVAERFGDEVEEEIRYNVRTEEVETKKTLKNGKEKIKKEQVKKLDEHADQYSEYAKFFDNGSREWMKDPEANLIFLRAQENYFTQLLRVKKRVFLNQVYEALDIPPTKAGQVVGWCYDDTDPTVNNHISFGLYDGNGSSRCFVNGYTDAILLDFNVDGNIWELMD